MFSRECLPKGHDKSKPVPLVLALHGGGGTAKAFDRSTNGQFKREADKRGYRTGAAFHVGSQCGDPEAYYSALKLLGVDDNRVALAGIDLANAEGPLEFVQHG